MLTWLACQCFPFLLCECTLPRHSLPISVSIVSFISLNSSISNITLLTYGHIECLTKLTKRRGRKEKQQIHCTIERYEFGHHTHVNSYANTIAAYETWSHHVFDILIKKSHSIYIYKAHGSTVAEKYVGLSIAENAWNAHGIIALKCWIAEFWRKFFRVYFRNLSGHWKNPTKNSYFANYTSPVDRSVSLCRPLYFVHKSWNSSYWNEYSAPNTAKKEYKQNMVCFVCCRVAHGFVGGVILLLLSLVVVR